jgi:hypothetical protein
MGQGVERRQISFTKPASIRPALPGVFQGDVNPLPVLLSDEFVRFPAQIEAQFGALGNEIGHGWHLVLLSMGQISSSHKFMMHPKQDYHFHSPSVCLV